MSERMTAMVDLASGTSWGAPTRTKSFCMSTTSSAVRDTTISNGTAADWSAIADSPTGASQSSQDTDALAGEMGGPRRELSLVRWRREDGVERRLAAAHARGAVSRERHHA